MDALARRSNLGRGAFIRYDVLALRRDLDRDTSDSAAHTAHSRTNNPPQAEVPSACSFSNGFLHGSLVTSGLDRGGIALKAALAQL